VLIRDSVAKLAAWLRHVRSCINNFAWQTCICYDLSLAKLQPSPKRAIIAVFTHV